MAVLHGSTISFPAGGLTGNVSVFSAPDTVWAFANSADGSPHTRRGPLIVRLDEGLGGQHAWEAPYPNSYGTNAAWISDEEFLIVGNAGLAVVSRAGGHRLIIPPHSSCMGAMPFRDGWLFASDEVDLCTVNVRNDQVERVAQLNMPGSIFEIAPSRTDCTSGYLFGHYATVSGSRGAIIRFAYR